MKKIDRETVDRILSAADIVEVVSDFVTLRRSGANYMGLCPFHSERTPSFSVSKAKGICKCFSCGKGGSPVNFLMELEQMSYQEALRWLARKYNITIVEQEETPEERRQAGEREALFAVNDFALTHFEHNLHETNDGIDIGLAYFKERGLSTETIKKFRLGYALERSDSLYNDAVKNGFTEDYLLKTGLCARSERGPYDRFRGRVIYPVHSISGKIVAFGGRTLKSDKNVAKYVNSPESIIYSKSRELYGLFQARRAIVKEDKCYLVEGYMDVISMSQSGVENVVASSGTSLTEQQVNLIHRFTNKVTVIYDADAAGIKASLRGVDMLLKEGIDVKVVLFPEGEDPDSYARSHTRDELSQYLNSNETDFIRFKTKVLLGDTADDPRQRSSAIADILRSIAVIPDPITRQAYIDETARAFDMEARMLALEVSKGVAKIAEETFNRSQREESIARDEALQKSEEKASLVSNVGSGKKNPLLPYEKTIITYLLKYGMIIFTEAFSEGEEPRPVTVLEFINEMFDQEGLSFSDPTYSLLYERMCKRAEQWSPHLEGLQTVYANKRREMREEGIKNISQTASTPDSIRKAEAQLEESIKEEIRRLEISARLDFFSSSMLSDPDDNVRHAVTDLVSERHRLSKMHSKYGPVTTDIDRLTELIPRALYELEDAILATRVRKITEEIKTADSERIPQLMADLIEQNKIRQQFALYLGERIITPKK